MSEVKPPVQLIHQSFTTVGTSGTGSFDVELNNIDTIEAFAVTIGNAEGGYMPLTRIRVRLQLGNQGTQNIALAEDFAGFDGFVHKNITLLRPVRVPRKTQTKLNIAFLNTHGFKISIAITLLVS